MSILGKLFGRKKDDLGIDESANPYGTGNEYGQPLGSPDAAYGAPGDYGAQQAQGGFSPEAMDFERVPPGSPSYGPRSQSLGEINMGKDLEIINAKLDAIKAEIDSVNQRLKRLERIAEGDTSEQSNKWNY